MILKRFLLIFVVAFILQAGAFAAYYDDLLFLHRPVAVLSAVSPDEFVHHATRALARKNLTIAHIETIAQVAHALNRPDLEATALERKVKLDDGQSATRLRLADAFRRAGEPVKAERVYLEILAGTHPEVR